MINILCLSRELGVVVSKFLFKQDLFVYMFPEGVPRNSFIVLAGEGGSGKSVILAHFVKDFLLEKEPVIYVALDDDPYTVISQLAGFKIDIDKAISNGLLMIIDGFSYLIRAKRGKLHEGVVDEINPRDPDLLLNSLIKIVDSKGMENKGVVIIDSLNETMITLDPTRFMEIVKLIRANISKLRKILTIATLHTSTESFKEYLLSIEHLIDGLIETSSIPSDLMTQMPLLVRQLVVRKIKGAGHKHGVVLYTIDQEGIKPVIIRMSEKG